ncbi:MAG: TonB-dependent receptor domain-containing protein [Candidatus Binataceae bacterium]
MTDLAAKQPVTTWAVVAGAAVHTRSFSGPRGRWYQNVFSQLSRLGTWSCVGRSRVPDGTRGGKVSTEEFEMRRFVVVAITLLTMTFIFMPLARAASTGAEQNVTGTVADALGRALADVQVVLRTQDGHMLARTRSDKSGAFQFRNVPNGTYEIEASKNGFKQGVEVVKVTSQGAANLEIALQAEAALSLQVATTRINPQPNSLSETGNSQYTLTQRDINALPQGQNTPINEVLLQMPGVVQDDEAQIHVDGEHEDLQWRVNGVMMPMDSFSGFGQIFNSFFIKRLSLLDGVLPVNYGYRDAGVLDMVTKDGCSDPGGYVGFYGGQRTTTQPSIEYGGCEGQLSYYFTGTYLHDNMAFSSATPGPTPYHNITNQGQAFGNVTYQINDNTKLNLITGISVNHSQYPSEPGLPPQFTLAGVSPSNYPSVDIAENLNQDYYFGVLALAGVLGPDINYQVAYTGAYSSIKFNPDGIGDLIYQGVASKSFHTEFDNTLQTDMSRQFDTQKYGSHNIGWGFYLGEYGVEYDDTTLAFPTNSAGMQIKDTPVSIIQNNNNINMLYGVYLQDIWQVNEQLTVTAGVRYDGVSGIINTNMPSPRINLLYKLNADTAFHAGFARYFQTPDFQTISSQSFEVFKNTTAAVGAGGLTPLPERDSYWSAGVLHHFGPHLVLEENGYFRLSHDLIDLGQFGFVPIFVPFNYTNGRIYGSESSASYSWKKLSVRANFTYSVAQGNQVATGQFNFTPAEVNYIRTHYIFLDHDQQYTASGGITYNWRSYLFSADGTYGSGLRSGFANTQELGENFQINLAAEKGWQVDGLGLVKTRVVLVNATDNINELRNGTGIGIFAPGYGPRRTVYGGITVPLPPLGQSVATP